MARRAYSDLEEELAVVTETGLYKSREAFLSDAVATFFAARPDLREAVACGLYEKGLFSLGRAAEWSGLSIEEIKESLHRRGIVRQSSADLAELEEMARISGERRENRSLTRAIVLDTDFLSAFLKIDRLSLVRDFYAVETLLVPPAVYHEVSRTKLVESLAALPWIHIEPPGVGSVLLEDDPRLGGGEREAIALAGQRDQALLLTNDNRALDAARKAGLNAVDIPAFLLSCKVSGFLEREQIRSLIQDLREKDRYGFRKEVLDLLLS